MSRDKHIEIALQDAERYARPHMDQGKVATYIPELAKGDPTKLGICIRTPDGEEYCQGDCQTEFSIWPCRPPDTTGCSARWAWSLPATPSTP